MVFFDVTVYFNVCLAVCLWWIYDVFVIEEEGFFIVSCFFLALVGGRFLVGGGWIISLCRGCVMEVDFCFRFEA